LSTALHGRPGAFVPVPAFDRVMPLELPPVPLLRALLVGDAETARALGCMGLIEEDLALLAYVCPGKHDYGPLLRSALAQIEKEG
jgi:Na+-transporting NADH:ubiquinone oxidoreductase subunit A